MNYLCALICLSFAALTIAAEFGAYVPRAVYTIDEGGNASPLVFINSIPEAFHRVRRQVNNAPGFGFPFPGFNFPNIQPIGCPPGGNCQTITTTQTGGGPDLASRFGEENTNTDQTITTTVNKNGHRVTTVHRVKPDGSLQQVSQKKD